ncbi:MAG: hypothetical protein U0529_14300 [Thermoanaerobaculia bacterium]
MYLAARPTPIRFDFVVAILPVFVAFLCMALMLSGGAHGIVCLGRPVLLPIVGWAPKVGATPQDSEFVVQCDGTVFLDRKWFPDPELPAMFQSIFRRTYSHPGSRVLLRLDRTTPFRTVRYILKSLREIGIAEATFLVLTSDPYGIAPAPNPGVQRTRYARR